MSLPRLPIDVLNGSSLGILLGGQASGWFEDLRGYRDDAATAARIDKALAAARQRLAPIARELGQIVPGAAERVHEILSGADASPIDAEPAVSVSAITVGHLAALRALADEGLALDRATLYPHSQAVITCAVADLAAGEWDEPRIIDHLAFAIVLGAATSQAHFGRMLAVRGVPVAALREAGIPLGVINSPTRAVVSGTEQELREVRRAVTKLVDKHNARIEAREVGGEPIELVMEDLGIDAAFHHEGLREAADLAVEWSTRCGLAVDARGLADAILVDPFEWAVGRHDYLLSLDKPLGAITAPHTDAVVVDASTPARRDRLATPGTQLPAPRDYARFMPQLVSLPDGLTVLTTRFSELTGYSPILLAGMTPTTVDAGIVAAAANAGHWAELAGGGQYSEKVFERNQTNLQNLLKPGRAAQFNSMFFDRYMWNLQFGQQKIVSKARAGGASINGVTISAGIPELDEATELITTLHAEGFPYVAFKPGTVGQIRQVLAIADANPGLDIIMQAEDGHAGGHHSWVDLEELLLATYAEIRDRGNVVVVVGGGIGTPARAAEFVTGSWAVKHGRQPLPVDGVLVGTAAMAAKEATTSPQVKELLKETPGIEQGWVGRLKSDGGMTSGQSHLLADMYEIDNDFARASRLITSLDIEDYAAHKAEIIEAINKTAKPYFGEVEDMTYAQWVRRFVELAYPFTDPTWSDRFFDLLRRVEARLAEADHGEIPTLFASIEDVEDAPWAVDKLLQNYPQADSIRVLPQDAAWFIALNRKHHKPMPWVPIIDGDLKRWLGLDSLWQAQDASYPASAVRIIPGPISVGGITEIDEPVASILGRFESACIEATGGDVKPRFSRRAATAEELIRTAPTIFWHGHLIDNPLIHLDDSACELIGDDPTHFTLRVHADSYWDDLPEGERPFYVEHVDIPLELTSAAYTGGSPVVDEARLSESVFALLAGVAGVGSVNAAGQAVTDLARVDHDGTVSDEIVLPGSLLRTHAGVAGGDPDEVTPDALVGLCWPAIYTALGTGRLADGFPVIEGLLNAVHLDHVLHLYTPLASLADGLPIAVEGRCESIAESASGRVVTVVLALRRDDDVVAELVERFAIRGRAHGKEAPVPAPSYGGALPAAGLTGTPRSFVASATVTAPRDMTAFATVTGDYNPIHTSTAAAQLVGLSAPLVHGMWLSATAQQLAGRAGEVVGWTYSMYGMVNLGDTVDIQVERVGRVGVQAALEVTCKIDGAVVSRGQALLAEPAIAYVFPGQGIQAVGMGAGDRQASPAARAAWERADVHTRKNLGFSIVSVIDENPTELVVGQTRYAHPKGVLNLTQFTQVALAVVAYGQTARLGEADAISARRMFAGHSLGEYTALACMGNLFDLEAVIDIVFARGQAMHNLVPRDEAGRSNYGLAALRPNLIGLEAAEVAGFVERVAADSGEFLEIVNHNIAGQQYAVAGTLAGLAALKTACSHPKAFVQIPGIDVPFHSAVLRPGVEAFAAKLDELLPEHIDLDALVGRYVPNLVARPFALTDEFIDSIREVVPSTRLDGVRAGDFEPEALARLLLVELLSWQFASPVRWIETQELLFDSVDRVVEVGLAASPTLTNLAQRSLKVLGRELEVLNVERDQEKVQLEDAVSAPEAPAPEPAEEAAAPSPEPTPEPQPAPTAEAPAPAPASAAAASGPLPELPFDAASATYALFAYENKLRTDQIGDADTLELLTGGVSSRRNQLLMDLSAELGVAAIDGAADAEMKVLRAKVTAAAPTYQAFGPVLGEAISARLRQLLGASGRKPAFVREHAATWGIPESWLPHVELALLLDTREGQSLRGGELGSLPASASSVAEVKSLIDAAVGAVAAAHGATLAPAGAASAGGVTVDSAALDAFAETITGPEGILATTARGILAQLGISEATPAQEDNDQAVYEAMDAELGPDWLGLVAPVFDPRKAVLFDDLWASGRELLARVATGQADLPAERFAGLGETLAGQAEWWAEHTPARADRLHAIAAAARGTADEPMARDVAIVTGASPHSIAASLVEKLLAQGATVIMTASRIDQARKEFARLLFAEHATPHAKLWLIPANLSSYRDTDALAEWVGTEQVESKGGKAVVLKPALEPTLVFPFAAPKVHGIMTDAGPVQENQARLLLWSVERLIAAAARFNQTSTVHAVLPGSPNRGTFGGDGAYGEVKAGFDALINKWHVESGWPEKITLAHAQIGWVAGTNLMGGNDLLVPKAQAAGITVYTPDTIATKLVGLASHESRVRASVSPLEADFTGGLATTPLSLADLAPESPAEPAPEEAPQVSIPALPTPVLREQPGAIDTGEVTQSLDDMVVIVGLGEVSSWGSGRTRFEAEMGLRRDGSVDLSAAGVLELAWMMQLIQWKEDPAPGWYDADDHQVAEEDIYDRFRDEVVAHCGIRELSDKFFLHDKGSIDASEVFLDKEITFTVASKQTARDYLEADPQFTAIAPAEDGEWAVTRAKGATARVPRKATLTRFVAGQMPDNFDPTRWGIPASMVSSIDRIAAWNLVTAVDAFLSAGFSPAELLQAVHPGAISSTQGTGIGGMESLHKVFVSRFIGEDRPSDILQEALPNVVAAHVMQSYIGGYGQMIHPVAACATAAVSVEEAVDKIKLGKSDVVVAGGIDDVQVESLTGFGDMNATADTQEMLDKGIDARFISRANDTRRGGFLEAEGGGTVILARGSVAAQLGLPVLAVVAHAQSYGDGVHTSIPAPGLGALGAARGGKNSPLARSLRALGLRPDDVQVVSKHDTSTNANDPNESLLHARLWAHLGRSADNPLFVVSQKSLTGHAKGGAALFQMGGLVDIFAHGRLPGNISLDNVDRELEAKSGPLVWLKSPFEVGQVKAGVLTSLGFGHVSAVVVLAHPGVFAKVAGEAWREQATRRLNEGRARVEKGMLGRAPLFELPEHRRLPEQDTEAAEIAMLLSDASRLGSDGFYPGA
ncbi:type I polyketide synthase [Corynebacterium vitaeruminis]|uniref:type I polyketide synthase n=1 Tax=Corynebacterium vitaeruminis TaxID=38305 RepID=UPI0005504DE1|nr:type I polyketide synthase [Corynebacterium vitaeruminis]